jgi:hypothetical protein
MFSRGELQPLSSEGQHPVFKRFQASQNSTPLTIDPTPKTAPETGSLAFQGNAENYYFHVKYLISFYSL